ncbi:YciI family protein [Nonomuraea harbinensis]|uniref:YciI family protein n=1 Tax=Nonomuraea harbinensis TaxID=1286938 RepID=A0ABW1C756_9ACTN|nr:YciI family protein [Nonomuraea harbinensis]
MRFMIIRRAGGDIEAGHAPSHEIAAELRVYGEALAKAGVLLFAGKLHQRSREAQIAYSGGEAVMIGRPFTETEWIAGFWLIQAKDRAEAVEWARRVPVLTRWEGVQVEVWQCSSRP